MTLVKMPIVVECAYERCILCDFCVAGTKADKKLGSDWICVAGKVGVWGKETLTYDNVTKEKPDWCPLEEAADV